MHAAASVGGLLPLAVLLWLAACSFRSALEPAAQVFWTGPQGRTWLVLGTATWFSADQGAGIVFNRRTAIEYANRKLDSSELRAAIENCAMVEQPDCRIDARPARGLCDRPGGPDYLVLNARIDGYAALEWPLPAEIRPGRQSLFLYACRALTANEKAGARPAFLVLPGRAYSERQTV